MGAGGGFCWGVGQGAGGAASGFAVGADGGIAGGDGGNPRDCSLMWVTQLMGIYWIKNTEY